MDLLAVQETLKSLLQHHSSKPSILRRSAFFIVQLSHPYRTIGGTIALTTLAFVDKVMSLLFSMLSRLVITFLPIYIFGCAGSSLLCRFSSLVVASRGYCLVAVCRLLIAVASHAMAQGL